VKDDSKTLGILALLVAAIGLIGGYFMGMGGWGGMMCGWGGMGVGMGIFWLLVLAGIYLLLTQKPQAAQEDRSLAVLRERYARGEITLEEFEEMRRNL